jgi:DNA-dependent RNA polymerase auxiliary subunit epsilon
MSDSKRYVVRTTTHTIYVNAHSTKEVKKLLKQLHKHHGTVKSIHLMRKSKKH